MSVLTTTSPKPTMIANGGMNARSTGWGQILNGGDKIVALGRYRGTCKKTGTSIHAQVAHVWTVENGKAASFQQYTDTLQITRAMEP